MAAPEDIVVVRAMGVPVAVPAADAATAARLRHQWARALTDVPPEVLLEDPPAADDPLGHDYAVSVLITLEALRATAGTRLNIHAGAAANPAGHAIAVVGRSGSGKTTAIRALATRLGYLSDETVSLDDDLVIHPHPKPLSVIVDPSEPRRKTSVSPDDAGLLAPPDHATLCRIVLLRRGRGEGVNGLEAVPTAEAIVEIVPETSSLVLLDHPLLTLAGAIDRCGGALALYYDEVVDHLDDLVGLLDTGPAPSEPPVHHPSVDPPEPRRGQWSRAPWLDAVQYDDDLVVMVEEVAHLLAGIGTTVWLALAEPATVEKIVAATVATHGPHPDARALVEDALTSLGERAILVAPADDASPPSLG